MGILEFPGFASSNKEHRRDSLRPSLLQIHHTRARPNQQPGSIRYDDDPARIVHVFNPVAPTEPLHW